MVIGSLLAVVAIVVVGGVRYLRISRALHRDRQAVARERDHLNRTWNYQTGRVLRP